ncbi:MAG: ABC transporter permease [Chlamydiia bacterium]
MLRRGVIAYQWLSGILGLGGFLLLWAFFASYYDPSGLIFPGPWATFAVFFLEMRIWIPSAWNTYSMMVLTLAGSLALSLPIVFGMMVAQPIRATVQTCFIIFQCLPLFVLAPILVMVFGWSSATILLPSVLMVLYPLTMALWKGAASVPQDYLDLFTSCEASRWRLFWNLQMPFASTHLFAGMRVAVTTCGMAVVACEFAVGQEGLGMLLQESRRNFDLAMAFCSIAILGMEIASLYLLVVFLEWFLLPWRRHAHMD